MVLLDQAKTKQSQPLGSPSVILEKDKTTMLEEKIKRVWQKVLNKQDIDLEENFFDVGGDSLLLPYLLFTLQEELEQKIEFIDLATYPSIKQFAVFLKAKSH